MKRGVAGALVVALVLALVVGGIAAIFGGGSSGDGSSPTTVPTASTTSTTRVEFSGVDSELYCEANARLNQELAAGAPTSNEPAALEAFYDQRVAAIRELESVAPAEIQPDVSVTAGAFDAFRPVLAAVNWDQSQVSPADAAAIQTAEVTRASQRLAQYDERVCGISIPG